MIDLELIRAMEQMSDEEIIQLAGERSLPVEKTPDGKLKDKKETINFLIKGPGGCTNCGKKGNS